MFDVLRSTDSGPLNETAQSFGRGLKLSEKSTTDFNLNICFQAVDKSIQGNEKKERRQLDIPTGSQSLPSSIGGTSWALGG